MDLVRKLLIEIENIAPRNVRNASTIELREHSEDEIVYHADLLIEAGLVVGKSLSSRGQNDAFVSRLTWQGHEFLEAAREPSRWSSVMEQARNVGGATLPIIQSLLTSAISNKLGLP